MEIAFVVDPLDILDPRIDTSVGLMEAAQGRGHRVWVTEAHHLEVAAGKASARFRQIRLAPAHRHGHRWELPTPWFSVTDEARLPLGGMDAVFMRTDPPVDQAYLHATYILDLVDPATTAMINDPRGLRLANEKLVALRFPDLIPPTIVTAEAESIAAFVAAHRAAVLKPIEGHAGRGVLRLSADDLNLNSIVETATAGGRRPVVVQAWLGEVGEGNKRIFVLDGEAMGAVLRFPTAGDFRIGPPAAAAPLTSRDGHIVERLAPELRRLGLRLVGLDVIGGFLIEVNVTSPGALRKADGLLGTRLCEEVIQHLEETGPQPAGARDARARQPRGARLGEGLDRIEATAEGSALDLVP